MLGTYDWLSHLSLPQEVKDQLVEVRFKNTRKEFFVNKPAIVLQMGDVVVTEGSHGEDVGTVSLVGRLAEFQRKKKDKEERRRVSYGILRKAGKDDITLWEKSQKREQPTLVEGRKIIEQLGLDMKLSDVEFQGDNRKAIFYYTSDGRVDFRELIKVLAGTFKVRVEMKQIGARQEAGRIGGLGSCGRELCCSTWLTDFRTVSTTAARYQQLSINPAKLAGQCGKLKCCLNYELDTYLDALKKYPEEQTKIKTEEGIFILQKIDIFQKSLQFAMSDNPFDLRNISLDRYGELEVMIKEGLVPESLEMMETSQS